ncbi:SCP2 sterol-binding domain-containing protein [Aquabacterium sp.]|uniref:SCP2 sterol-binding domain-containing protein n=1 Tax=Aquabacterium sp. TaxID=1872578 RepID=UPI0035B15CCF
MSPNDIINRFPLAMIPTATANIKKTWQYNITHPCYVVLDHGKCEVHEGNADPFDVRFTISDDNLVALFRGELSGMAAFMSGKLKVEGDRMFAQRIPSLFNTDVLLGKV